MLFSCFLTLPRTLIISLAVLVLSWCCSSYVRSRLTVSTAALLVLPFIIPRLVIGYIYSSFSVALIREPFWNQMLYSSLVVLRLVPIGVLILYLVPRTISEESLFCLKMIPSKTLWHRWLRLQFFLKSCWKANVVCFIVITLLAFNEFEIASLMSVKHWTVALFDAHAQGLVLTESLKYGTLPLLLEGGLITIALVCLKGHELQRLHFRKEARSGKTVNAVFWGYIIIAWGSLVVIPLYFLLSQSVPAISLIFGGSWMGKEFKYSFLFAIGAGIFVFSIGNLLWWLSRQGWGTYVFKSIILIIIFAGLFGALPVALMVLSFFQKTSLNNSPFPLLICLFLLIFPYSVLLDSLISPLLNSSPLFCAEKSTQSPRVSDKVFKEIWLWKYLPKSSIFFLVFCWAFFDLTASAILAPPGMTMVVPRLYNLMHYGQSEKLSLTVLITIVLPVLFFMVMLIFSKLFIRIKRC